MPVKDRSMLRVTYFVLLVIVLVGGLVFLWKHLPNRSTNPSPPTSPLPSPSQGEGVSIVGTDGVTQTSCEAAHGYWIECGSPCHGKDRSACAQVCEPQCLCGGIAGWGCPKDLICSDWEPGQQVPDAIGVCRSRNMEHVTRHMPEGMICDETNSICVDESYENTLLANPFMVTGTAVAFENTIQWEIYDQNGITGAGFTTAQSSDVGKPGPFTIRDFLLSVPASSTGTLKIFESSAKDGQPIHVVSLPVRFSAVKSVVKYHASTLELDTMECEKTLVVMREIPRTSFPVEASIQTLLARDTGRHASPPFGTMIPEGTRLNSLQLSDGILKLVFSPELDQGVAGSCRVMAIRAQIEKTAKQFAQVKKVEITVEGKTPEETLQP